MEGQHTMAKSASTSPQSPPCASRARMKRLLDEGNSPKVLDTVPIDRYCKTMIQMYDVAQTYLRDKQYEKAFILLLRYSNLAVSLLPKHKNWNDWNSAYKTDVLQKARYAIGTAQDLRRYLEDLYEKEFLAELSRIQKEEDAEAAKQELIAKLEREKRIREENARAALMIQKRNQAHIENPGFTTDAISFGSLNLALAPQGQHKTTRGNAFDQLLAELDSRVKVVIAGDVAQKFLAAAQQATANNIETCGILCGLNYKSKLIITHVILPRQHGTPNSCFSEGEEDLFEAQSRLELLTFGWIHTHPSQSAFLSSVDLHTHHAYQTAVEDAVAIVCAPSFNEIGTYVITPEGMKIIGGCKLSGFHPHSAMIDPIFTEAPHARYTEKLTTTLVDLRSKT